MELTRRFIFGCLLVIGYSLAFVVLLSVFQFFRPSSKVLYAVVAASRNRTLALLWSWRLLLVIIVPFASLSVWEFGWQFWHPPWGSHDQQYAQFGAVFFVMWWLNWTVLRTGGFPELLGGIVPGPALYRVILLAWGLAICFGAMLGSLVMGVSGSFGGLLGMFGAVILNYYLSYMSLRMASVLRRGQAPIAEDNSRSRTDVQPVLLFLSDIHLTVDGRPQTSGDPSGNVNLDELIPRLTQKIRPDWVVIPGDLVETGTAAEWKLALERLNRIRDAGVRVILAPGNHDISAAYDPVASRRFLGRRGAGRVDGRKLASYLQAALYLDGDILSHDGRKLQVIWNHEFEPVLQLVRKWAQAAEEAQRELERIPVTNSRFNRSKERPPYALRYLEVFDKQKASALLDPLVESAMHIFSGFVPMEKFGVTKEGFWRKTFTASLACELDPLILADKWGRFWFDVFPLVVVDGENQIEFVVANSNVAQVGLFGSAFGMLTPGQEARIKRCIAATTQPTVVLLMHHPVCRWSDDRSLGRWPRIDLNRWGLLANDSEEARRIPTDLCSAAPPSCRQILLCGGHVHSIARAGALVDHSGKQLQDLQRLLILENPALPDVSWKTRKFGQRAGDLLVGVRTTSGLLRPIRVAWSELMTL